MKIYEIYTPFVTECFFCPWFSESQFITWTSKNWHRMKGNSTSFKHRFEGPGFSFREVYITYTLVVTNIAGWKMDPLNEVDEFPTCYVLVYQRVLRTIAQCI